MSSNRIDTDLVQKVNESREILEAAKEKLSGPSPTVDATTAKELKNVLSLVLEQTNKLQNQLPRSVWDRIAPPETAQSTIQIKKELDDDPLLKGRFVQETCAQDIVITAANKEYLEDTEDVKPKLPFKKYHNLAPLEPNLVMPVSIKSKTNDKQESHQRSPDYRNRQQNQGNSWNKNKGLDRNRWSNTGPMKKPISPMRKQELSFRRVSSPRRLSPKRPLLSPPRRPCSPPRRHFSPNRPALPSYQARDSPLRHEYSPQRRSLSPLRHMMTSSSDSGRRQMTSPRRPFSSTNRSMSPSRRPISPPRRSMSPLGRPMSPIRRQMSPRRRHLPSPSRRQMSPMRMYDSSSTRQMSPMRQRPISPGDTRHQTSPERRPMSPVGRLTSPPRLRGMMPPRHQSPMRRPSPHRMPPGRVASPLRRQQSPRRQSPPSNRFADEWDIPSRGAVEQNAWQRSVNERPPENVWRNERQATTSGNNWQLPSNNDRYRKSANQQDRSWDVRDSASGNSWGAKQPPAKPSMKDAWNQGSDNRWSGPSRLGNNSDNWNIRGKESLGGGRGKESWMDVDKPRWEQPQSNDSWNQGDKDDWNDLPEDARDPWGDEGNNLGLKERWMNFENQVASSSWSKEVDKGDPWTKPKESWQSKSQIFPTKPPTAAQNSGNSGMSDHHSRWLSLNDMNKKTPSTSWQGSTNIGAWQPLNYNFQTQRSFNTNPFKDRR